MILGDLKSVSNMLSVFFMTPYKSAALLSCEQFY